MDHIEEGALRNKHDSFWPIVAIAVLVVAGFAPTLMSIYASQTAEARWMEEQQRDHCVMTARYERYIAGTTDVINTTTYKCDGNKTVIRSE